MLSFSKLLMFKNANCFECNKINIKILTIQYTNHDLSLKICCRMHPLNFDTMFCKEKIDSFVHDSLMNLQFECTVLSKNRL